MRLVLYQPDMPGNVGTLLRLAACLDVPVDIIEPCGFPFSDRGLKRAGMDYAAAARIVRHDDWQAFRAVRGERLVLLTVRASQFHVDAAYRPDDLLMVGSEGAGVPEAVHAAADLRVRVPLAKDMRSLNVAVAAAMVLGEALRQTGQFPS